MCGCRTLGDQKGLGKCNLNIFLKVAKESPQLGWKRGGREAPGSSSAAGAVSPEGQGPAVNSPEVVQAQLRRQRP